MRVEQMRTQPTGTSLPVLAENTWQQFGDSLITVFEGERWTAAGLGERARRFATGLKDLGVQPGDRVVVCMANCLEVGISYHGGWRAGAVVTPVLFLLSEDELRHVLIDSGARLVVTTPEFLAKVVAAAADAPAVRGIVVAGDFVPGPGLISFAAVESGAEAGLPDVDSTDLAALLYTGGTTGRSKGVMLSHDALSAAGWSATLTGVDETLTSSLLPLPLAHVYGLMVSTMQLHMVHSMTSVLMRWFDPKGWLALAQAEQTNTSPVVPTMLRLLLQQPLEDYDLSALRRLTSGSAPLPAEVRLQWNERVPHVELVEGYGCTETAAIISSCPLGQSRAGSVGVVSPIAELGIETEVGAGPRSVTDVDGEICVRGPMLLTGYWQAEDGESAVVDGWFHTGDVGRLDADGYLYIVDRIKDVIIRDGFNVYPRDIEEALMAHPDVLNCAVIGRPDDRHGEVPVAFVELRPNATTTEEALREFAKSRISAVKYPREITIIGQVPLTSVGKVDRKRLRATLD